LTCLALERQMDPFMFIPARIEIFDRQSYAVFRLTQSFSSVEIEAVLHYSFENLKSSHGGTDILVTLSAFSIHLPSSLCLSLSLIPDSSSDEIDSLLTTKMSRSIVERSVLT
jgi:hypothetical protein